jgi:hypothetical protein
MRYSLVVIGIAALAACDNSPRIDERNVSVEAVAQKVREAGNDDLFRPGKWQTKVTVKDMTIPGMPPSMQGQMKQMLAQRQNVVSESCLTPEDAKRPGGKFFTGKESSNCRYERFTMSGGRVDALMRCEGGQAGAMVMALNGTYTPTQSTTSMDMEVSGPEGTMKMTAVTENRRIGDCTRDEAKAAAGGEG